MITTKTVKVDWPLVVGSVVDLAGEDYVVDSCEPDILMKISFDLFENRLVPMQWDVGLRPATREEARADWERRRSVEESLEPPKSWWKRLFDA